MTTEVKPPAAQNQAAPPAASADTAKKVSRPLTIGRIVIYQVRQGDGLMANGPSHLPAMVVRANNDENANLKVFCDGDGVGDEWRVSVPMGPDAGQWQWPDIAQPLSDEATKPAA